MFFNLLTKILYFHVFLFPLSKPPLLPIRQLKLIKKEPIDVNNLLLINLTKIFLHNLLRVHLFDLVIKVYIALLLKFPKKLDDGRINFLDPVHDHGHNDIIGGDAVLDEGGDIIGDTCQGFP